ncbi:hypothetical protein PVAND_001076 [Polypedilum vanderplanki]|uniref:Uncharacterized protein n=1 Tax=Polypedilum vanderplanki TaxID=319348 RepID=A0A9J6BM50_POLVA|nr:hypothetical protein PVAND_001076 [Polypedilum vanderplanki]
MILINFKKFLIVAILIYDAFAGGPGFNNCVEVIDSFSPLISSFQSTIASFRDQALSDIKDAFSEATDLQKFSAAAKSILEALEISLQVEVNEFLKIVPQIIPEVNANDCAKYFLDRMTVEGPLKCLDQNIIYNISNDAFQAAFDQIDNMY